MKSDRISLINYDEKLFPIILKGDEYLAKELDIIIPERWSEFGKEIFEFAFTKLKEKATEIKWYCYLPIEIKTKALIGSCGFKGEPDEDGIVEIGYEVAKEFRNQGYATEITQMLLKIAFADKRVEKVRAHTLAEKNASVSVLEKCNFKFIEEYYVEEDGLIWKWRKEK